MVYLKVKLSVYKKTFKVYFFDKKLRTYNKTLYLKGDPAAFCKETF